MLSYIANIALAVDVLANALLGGEAYQTISCRIGLSILKKGWAYSVPWPNWARDHFLSAVYRATV